LLYKEVRQNSGRGIASEIRCAEQILGLKYHVLHGSSQTNREEKGSEPIGMGKINILYCIATSRRRQILKNTTQKKPHSFSQIIQLDSDRRRTLATEGATANGL
jgi:hypothetical protein